MKKLAVFFTALLILFTTIGSTSAAPLFQDVGDSHRTKAELDFLAERGIITADPSSLFGINDDITRLEASDMILKALGVGTEEYPEVNFADVIPGDMGYDVIAKISELGIMTGNEKNEFKPYDRLTRAQMAAILTRAFDLLGTSPHSFSDVPDTHWASLEIKSLFVNGVTTGYEDNTFKPELSLSKVHFSVFLARILNPDFKNPEPTDPTKPVEPPAANVCVKPNTTKTYAISVAVSNLWFQPNRARVVDRPTVANPVDMEKWIKSLSLTQKTWLVGKTDTQALYGDEVTILKTEGNWTRIAVKDQYKTNQKSGYEGWVPNIQVAEIQNNVADCSIAIVKAKIATLYNKPDSNSKFIDISYSTILPIIQEDGDWIHVQTPSHGVKYIRKVDVKTSKNLASVPKPTQKDIVDSAKAFTGLPYLWAGTSGFGFDCSGLFYAVYKNHGIVIPRDSFVQAIHGTPVARSNMQPGDLMYFAYSGGTGKVYHVAMYIGNSQMIHAPNSSNKVMTVSINSDPYKNNFSGARRYLK
ncbi:NlpC/P60 family protein [Sporosarcina sp. FA9]|uniref:NlpC/P60 family protein n=1 Tax=Sporosarcina sp. FA9 TaxID=3413030 RepID=UPI003F656428